MERDPELIRQILLEIESCEHGFVPCVFAVEGYTEEKVGYHCCLLSEAGLIIGLDVTSAGDPSPVYIPHRLTSQGHDFLDAARNTSVWRTAMSKTFDVGLTVSMPVLKQLLESLMRDLLGLRVGSLTVALDAKLAPKGE